MAPKTAPQPKAGNEGLQTLDDALMVASFIPVAGEVADGILAVRRGIDGARRWKEGDKLGAVLSFSQSLAWTAAFICPEIPGIEQALDGIGTAARVIQYTRDVKSKLKPEEPTAESSANPSNDAQSWMARAFLEGKSGEVDPGLSPALSRVT